jgi:AcrR family transcriptional regulator
MGRWEPDASGRLERAAMELFLERGYEQTTVADIAERAGLTERTFFRHFTDKREVLFGGSSLLADLLVGAVLGAPATASSMGAVGSALESAGELLEQRRELARRRRTVIAANAELRERELIKMASLAESMAGALRSRGVGEPAASLAAQAGIAVFRVAFDRWADDTEGRDLAALVRSSLAELRAELVGP